MKERYINSQKEKICEERKKLNNKKEIATTAAGLATVAFSVFTIVGLFSFPAFALASGIGTGVGLIARKKYEKLYDERLQRLENEDNHLSSLSEKVPTATTELNKKRVKKLKALKNKKKSTESSYEGAKSINGVAAVAEIAGIGLTFINPLFSIIGFGGLALNLINTHNMIVKNKENQQTINRIDNIVNDLEVIINDDRDKQGQRIGTRKVMKPTQTQNTKQKTISNNNVQAVNNYVNNLANQNQTNNIKQKVKK